MGKHVLKGKFAVCLDNTSVFAKEERQEKIAQKMVCYNYFSLVLMEFLLDNLGTTIKLSKQLIHKYTVLV